MIVNKDTKWLKRNNKLRIISEINDEPLSRSDIALNSGLAGSTVSTLVNEMISEGVIIELDDCIRTAGRPKKLLSLNEDYDLAWVIHVKGDSVSLLRYNYKASLISETELSEKRLVQNELADQLLPFLNCLRDKLPYHLTVLYDEEISLTDRQVYSTEWGEGVNLSISEYLSSKLQISVGEDEMNQYAYWEAMPSENSNFIVLTIGSENYLKIFIERKEVPVDNSFVDQELKVRDKLVRALVFLCSIFSIQEIIINSGPDSDSQECNQLAEFIKAEFENIEIKPSINFRFNEARNNIYKRIGEVICNSFFAKSISTKGRFKYEV